RSTYRYRRHFLCQGETDVKSSRTHRGTQRLGFLLENLRVRVPALASVRSGAAGRVARTPFGLLPALPLGIPFVSAQPCRWAGGKPGNLLRGGAAVAARSACTF